MALNFVALMEANVALMEANVTALGLPEVLQLLDAVKRSDPHKDFYSGETVKKLLATVLVAWQEQDRLQQIAGDLQENNLIQAKALDCRSDSQWKRRGAELLEEVADLERQLAHSETLRKQAEERVATMEALIAKHEYADTEATEQGACYKSVCPYCGTDCNERHLDACAWGQAAANHRARVASQGGQS